MNTALFRLPRKRHLVPLLVTVLLLLFVGWALAQPLADIDTFVTTQTSLSATNGAPAEGVSGNDSTNIIGAQREVYVQSNSAAVVVNFAGVYMDVNTPSGTLATVTLTYDGTTNVDPGPGQVGMDGLCTNPANATTCPDLRQGGLTNAFRFAVLDNDVAADLTVRVWGVRDTGTDPYCEHTFADFFPGNIVVNTNDPVPVYLFADYPAILGDSNCTGDTDTLFEQAGAIQFEIEGYALDMWLDGITLGLLDWGDLPDSSMTSSTACTTSPQDGYATAEVCEGPRHGVSGDLYLGESVDPAPADGSADSSDGELDGNPSTGADGDDLEQFDVGDDEDGIVPIALPPNPNVDDCLTASESLIWENGSPNDGKGGRIRVTMYGRGRLVGWIDFLGGGFTPTGDFDPLVYPDVIINEEVGTVNSSTTFCRRFFIPPDTIALPSTTLYARFRLFPLGELTENDARHAFDGRNGFGQFNGRPAPALSKDGEVEDYRWIIYPTAITLADFYAEQVDDLVRVTWQTFSELNNRGFNLYRGTSPDEPDLQLNTTLIPSQSQGNPTGFTYTWEDSADLVYGQTYWYWLEDLDTNGTLTRHGPVSVPFENPLAVTLASFAAQGQADRVLVSWETVSELDNASFNLYRSLDAAGPLTLLAAIPSQAPGSAQGAAYSYEDLDVQPGQTLWYTLEDVSLGGATTRHEPVSATVQAPTAVTLRGVSAGPAAGMALPWLWVVAGAGAALGLGRLRRR